jgi:hypothetical protein
VAVGFGNYIANGEHKYEGNVLTAPPNVANGGGCAIQQTTVTYNREVKFVKNAHQGRGGGVSVLGTTLTFNDSVEFKETTSPLGDNIYILPQIPSTVVFNSKSSFESVS